MSSVGYHVLVWSLLEFNCRVGRSGWSRSECWSSLSCPSFGHADSGQLCVWQRRPRGLISAASQETQRHAKPRMLWGQ
eukprot:3581718-Amphidinium_carterae.1